MGDGCRGTPAAARASASAGERAAMRARARAAKEPAGKAVGSDEGAAFLGAASPGAASPGAASSGPAEACSEPFGMPETGAPSLGGGCGAATATAGAARFRGRTAYRQCMHSWSIYRLAGVCKRLISRVLGQCLNCALEKRRRQIRIVVLNPSSDRDNDCGQWSPILDFLGEAGIR